MKISVLEVFFFLNLINIICLILLGRGKSQERSFKTLLFWFGFSLLSISMLSIELITNCTGLRVFSSKCVIDAVFGFTSFTAEGIEKSACWAAIIEGGYLSLKLMKRLFQSEFEGQYISSIVFFAIGAISSFFFSVFILLLLK
jgi:hypothetical protein